MSTQAKETMGFADEAGGLGLGIADIVYLISRNTGEPINKTASMLRLAEDVRNPQMASAGASSLLARGLLGSDGEEVTPSRQLALINYVFSNAERWTEFGLLEADALDAGLILDAAEATLLLQPRTLGAWFVAARDPELTTAGMLRNIVDGHLEARPKGSAYFTVSTLATAETMFVRKQDVRSWEIARGPADQKAEATARDLDSGSLDQQIQDMLPHQQVHGG